MPDDGQRTPARDSADTTGSITVLDRDVILDRVFGNVHLLQELVQLFFEECPSCLARIREAVARGDTDGLRQAAHLLRGAAGNFGPSPVYEAAGRLESMGRRRHLAGAEVALLSLEQGLKELQPVLAGLALESAS